jgi:hypothetical protein
MKVRYRKEMANHSGPESCGDFHEEVGAHQALATLHEKIAGGTIERVFEADLKNVFGSLKSRVDAALCGAPSG